MAAFYENHYEKYHFVSNDFYRYHLPKKQLHRLTYLLEKPPNDRMSDEELESMTPWNEEVKDEIERRAANSN